MYNSDGLPTSTKNPMPIRLLNVLFLFLISAGLVRLMTRNQVFRHFTVENQRLAAKVGELDVKDPSKYLIKRLATDDPMEFLWLCYDPNQAIELRMDSSSGGRSSTWSSAVVPNEKLRRCRFDVKNGSLSIHFLQSSGGSSSTSISSDSRHISFLCEHWSELDFNFVANNGPQEIDANQVVTLVEIRIPEHFRDEFNGIAGQSRSQVPSEPWRMKIEYGSKEAFELRDKQNAAPK
jgi:hypothetical protein